MARVVRDCLTANAASNLPEAMFTRLVQVRGELAFVLMQRLAEARSREADVRALLQVAWDSVRASGASFELALAAGDAAQYRSLLKVLFLALRAHVDAAPTRDDRPPTSPETLDTVLAIVDGVVAQGFRQLVAAVHERPREASPEDIALVTATLQSCLRVPGVEALHDRIAARVADHGTARVATTLFSWADRLAVDGDAVYGELAVLLLTELSTVPRLAEQMAVDGVLPQLAGARIMSVFAKGGVSPLTAPRLHAIWLRGVPRAGAESADGHRARRRAGAARLPERLHWPAGVRGGEPSADGRCAPQPAGPGRDSLAGADLAHRGGLPGVGRGVGRAGHGPASAGLGRRGRQGGCRVLAALVAGLAARSAGGHDRGRAGHGAYDSSSGDCGGADGSGRQGPVGRRCQRWRTPREPARGAHRRGAGGCGGLALWRLVSGRREPCPVGTPGTARGVWIGGA